MMSLDDDIINYNKVKDLVLNKLVEENLLDEGDADEFSERCQVLLYKGTWFSNWFNKQILKKNPEYDKNNYYMRIIELKKKEDDIDKLLRKTTENYDE
jgi:hypothetical protein